MKTVFITGASSGIGSATARLAVEKGWRVFVGFNQGRERARAIAKNDADAIQIDLCAPETIKAAVTALLSQTETLDAVILNAAPAPRLASFLKIDAQDLRTQFEANVVGNQLLIGEIYKAFFRKQKSGHIVGVLSEAMENAPWPHMTSYVVGKRGLQALLECALAELATSGVRASTVSPDYTETPMLMNVNEHVLEMARSKMPERKFLDPKDVAAEIIDTLENEQASASLIRRRVGRSGNVR